MALILVLGQFPRNIFCITSGVYAHDARVLAHLGQGVTLGQLVWY
ncbi:MAG: DUF924 domain-containing protein [Gammaproteobacteria bacterium]|nr:DUF924 domain-containing protein [Gammaproteobacteria bacterium]MCP4090242.1 DUF924 domain-containing protein [Gammaproteobacteria bacterium]MCP4276341.1 DUF924 domain-containing protein [Gammaproteobacteria bacterium]MCP4831186.1 DUF924 domain-containing protein [Gammaproteobacteria bacterium]MCP4930114.1 DUF924 domain-containing protein [Gammaproteobacteria bacterium]